MNAKEELLNILYGKHNTLCAEIYTAHSVFLTFLLKPEYTQKEWNVFTKSLDFEYLNHTSKQILFGTIWLQDGSWLKRAWRCEEFECIEYWEYHEIPKITKKLLK